MFKSPLRRRWRVERFRPWAEVGPFRNTGVRVEERAPAPPVRRFWTLKTARREAARLNSGMTTLQSKERFRVVPDSVRYI
jgi:hypothetical protein